MFRHWRGVLAMKMEEYLEEAVIGEEAVVEATT
jgi:hypothetical protein